MERAQSNAEKIADWLRRHPRVTTVNYAGLDPLSAKDAKAMVIAKRAALRRARQGRVMALRRTKSGAYEPGTPVPLDPSPIGVDSGDVPPSLELPERARAAPAEPSSGGEGGKGEGEGEGDDWRRADPESLHPLPSDEHLEATAARAAAARRIHVSQASGGGAVMSFTTGNVDTSRRIVDALRIFKITVSFGSCNSLVEMPVTLSHASVPKDKRTLPEDLVRLSVGIEDAQDLLSDLKQAFELACNPAVPDVQEVARRRRNSDAVFVFGDAAAAESGGAATSGGGVGDEGAVVGTGAGAGAGAGVGSGAAGAMGGVGATDSGLIESGNTRDASLPLRSSLTSKSSGSPAAGGTRNGRRIQFAPAIGGGAGVGGGAVTRGTGGGDAVDGQDTIDSESNTSHGGFTLDLRVRSTWMGVGVFALGFVAGCAAVAGYVRMDGIRNQKTRASA